MAPKRPSPLEEPPAASSSSEEEVSDEENEEEEGEGDSEEEEEESEEEEDPQPEPQPQAQQAQKQQHKKASSPPPPTPVVDKKSTSSKKPDTQPQSSSSGSESASGSESESDPDRPTRLADPNVKPIASKPMDDASSKVKKPQSKPSVSTPPAKSTTKRPIENSKEEKESKKSKKKFVEADENVQTEEKKAGDDTKKLLFQRLWSEDDEIAILKGILDYTSKKGTDPSADMNAFHEFLKKSLHVDVKRFQLQDKIRRLKKKYENNAGKGKNGEDRTFSKPHEQKAYELSKKIWGIEGKDNGTAAKSNGNARTSQKSNNKRLTPEEKVQLLASLRGSEEKPQKMDVKKSLFPSHGLNDSILFNKSIVAGGLDENFVKQGLDLIDSAKRAELEEKWRKLQMSEMEIFLRRIELVREQTKVVLDAYRASEH